MVLAYETEHRYKTAPSANRQVGHYHNCRTQMGAAELSVVTDRIKREECERTKHDSQFSKWQVLIGPSDWEDHSLGKVGAARYRVHNLPSTPSPGLYELGIAVTGTGLGRDVNKLDSDGVVVVYLGQADNVRSRLQCYGRTGAHLNNPNDFGLKNGPGCFDDIFSRGYSIVYRWVPMKNKADALKTETQLLNKFDYAWNKGGNGTRRHDDVLLKLNKVASRYIHISKPVRKLLYFTQKPEGIKIKAGNLLSQGKKYSTNADDESHNFLPQVFKFIKSRPRLVLDRQGSIPTLTAERKSQVDDAVSESSISINFIPICGFVLNDGSPCRRQPVRGNKRCDEHKGRKISGSNSKSPGRSQFLPSVSFDSNPDEASNYNKNSAGRIQPKVLSGGYPVILSNATICGVKLSERKFCTRLPVEGRVRCEEHKGLKVNGINTESAAECKFRVDLGSNFRTLDYMKYSSCTSVCGAVTLSGSYCTRPVKGNTRCWQHSGSVHVSDTHSTISSTYEGWHGGPSICGAPTRNGSYCRRTVKGGGTCWQH